LGKSSKKKLNLLGPGTTISSTPNNSGAAEGDGSASGEASGDPSKTKHKEDFCTLVECLERLVINDTSPILVGVTDTSVLRNFAAEKLTHYQCGNPECAKAEIAVPGAASSTESIKHVTVKSLPPVLAIQLKVCSY
jgi:hypothetical protein